MRLNMEDYIILSGMTNACLEVGIFHLNLKKVLFRNTLEHLLDRRRVADEAHGHLQALRRDVADAALHVVRNPLDKVRGVLVLNVEHLLINLLRRHAAAEETSRREVAPVARISSAPPRGS